MKMKLKTEDTVQLMTGKDKGKKGEIIRVDHGKNHVFVQGLNIMRKAVKPKKQNDKGGIIDIESPINASNVQFVCKKCGPTRLGYRIDNNEKVRICRKCGEAV